MRYLGFVLCAGIFSAMSAFGTTSHTIGTQDFFADGASVTPGAFNTAGTGEPSPFNATIGGDSTANMSATFVFSYTAQPVITSASLQVGFWDLDSASAGNQIASFTLNGAVNLTAVLNTAVEADPVTSGKISLITITLPSTAFAALETGTASFFVQLQGPVDGIAGPTSFNGGGLDFATLTYDGPAPVPEPSSVLLMGTGIAALAAWRRRKA